MLDQFERQIIRSALAELSGEIGANLANAGAQAKLQMTSLLLAHMLGREGKDQVSSNISDEVQALHKAENDEHAALQAAAMPQGNRLSITKEGMTAYLRDKLSMPDLVVTGVQASLGGYSKQTYILKLKHAGRFGDELVLRRDQDGGPVEVLAADEYPVIKLMFERGVPVAEALLVDRDPPFGATLMVMRMMPGKSPFDLTGQRLGPEGREASLALARVLGQIHSTPVAALQLPAGLVQIPLAEHVRRMIANYEDQWRRRRVADSPTLAGAFAWLYANIPIDDFEPALVHGDASLRNLLVHEGRESAMLDWELWHLGDSNEDLAYCRSEVESVLPWEAFMKEYLAHGGLPYRPDSDNYFAVFGAVRNAVFVQSCLHGFVNAENPEAKFAYGPIALGRQLIYGLAEMLKNM